MPRITVIGAGFGALTAIRKLRTANASVQIDVVAPKPEFVYYPGTIWIPTRLREPEDLVVPLHNFFRRMGVSYHEAEVTGLRDAGRTVETSTDDLANDGLIIASGGRFIRKLPGIEHSITPCGGIAATVEMRRSAATSAVSSAPSYASCTSIFCRRSFSCNTMLIAAPASLKVGGSAKVAAPRA